MTVIGLADDDDVGARVRSTGVDVASGSDGDESGDQNLMEKNMI